MGKNMRLRKKKLNDMCCNEKPTRMVVQNRVTLDNVCRSTKNTYCTTHKKKETDAHEHRCGSRTETSSAGTCLTEKTAAKHPLLPPLTYNRSTRLTAQNTKSNSYKKRVCQKLCAFRQHVSQFVLRTKPTTISEVRAQMRWRNNPQTRSRPHKNKHIG